MPRCTHCDGWVGDEEDFCDQCGIKIPDDASDDRWGDRVEVDDSAMTREKMAELEREEFEGSADDDRSYQAREPPLEFLLRHPLREGRRPLILGTLLMLGSVLVIPTLILAGYSYRLGRQVAFERDDLPVFDAWKELTVDGARLAAVVAVPSLLWAVATAVVVWLLAQLLPGGGGLVSIFLLFSLAGLLWFVGGYVLAFLGTNSVRRALLDGRARTIHGEELYQTFWALFLVFILPFVLIGTAVSGPALILAIIGVTPILLAPVALVSAVLLAAVLSYGLLVSLTYAGYIYWRAARINIVPEPDDDSRPVSERSDSQPVS